MSHTYPKSDSVDPWRACPPPPPPLAPPTCTHARTHRQRTQPRTAPRVLAADPNGSFELICGATACCVLCTCCVPPCRFGCKFCRKRFTQKGNAEVVFTFYSFYPPPAFLRSSDAHTFSDSSVHDSSPMPNCTARFNLGVLFCRAPGPRSGDESRTVPSPMTSLPRPDADTLDGHWGAAGARADPRQQVSRVRALRQAVQPEGELRTPRAPPHRGQAVQLQTLQQVQSAPPFPSRMYSALDNTRMRDARC